MRCFQSYAGGCTKLEIDNSVTQFFIVRSVLESTYQLRISREQYEDLSEAITTQWEALYLEQKFDFVVENYLELEETILKCGLEYMVLGRRRSRAFELDTALFNRRIMNFLTTYKTYVDSFPQHFNNIFSRDKDVTRAAETSFSQEYDSRVGYWLLPKLRNFVQHQGFPVHGSSYASAWISADKNDGRMNRYTIDLFLTPQELIKGDFKQTVLERISKMSSRIDLKFIIRDFMEGFADAHVRNRDLLAQKLEWAAHYVESAEFEFLNASGDNSSVALAATSTALNSSPIYLNKIANEHYAHLVSKNGRLVNLAARYISSEVFSDKPEPT